MFLKQDFLKQSLERGTLGHFNTTWPRFFRFSLYKKVDFLFKTLIQEKKLQCYPKALLSAAAN
jgi:hypothetical protein